MIDSIQFGNYSSIWSNANNKIISDISASFYNLQNDYAVVFPCYSDKFPIKYVEFEADHSDFYVSVQDDANLNNRRHKAELFFHDGKFLIPIELFPVNRYNVRLQIFLKKDFIISKVSFKSYDSTVFKFKIMLESGIGDALRAVSRNSSLEKFSLKYPVQIYWSYGGNGLSDSGWTELLQKNIFGRNENFKYVAKDEFVSLPAVELFNGYSGSCVVRDFFDDDRQGFQINLTKEERLEVVNLLKKTSMRIGLQLEGNDPNKKFTLDFLNDFLDHILKKYPYATVFIIDGPKAVFEYHAKNDSRIVNLIGKTNISQNINLIKNMDLWLAPDSFGKYVAKWADVRQFVFCCKLSYRDPHDMLKNSFDSVNLLEDDHVKLIGIDYDEGLNVSRVVDSLSDIKIDDVIDYL